MKNSNRLSQPVMRSVLLGGLFLGLLSQGCASSEGGSERGGSGGTSAGGITGSGTTSSTGGASTGGAGSGGVGSGSAGSGSAGKSTGGAGTGGSASSGGGAGAGGSGTGSAGKATGGAGTGGSAGAGGSGTGGAAGTGTGGGAGSGGAGSGGSTAGAGGSAGASSAGGSRGGSTGTGGAGGTAAFNPCPAAGTPCAIMPLGDSITDGVGSSAPGGGYRVELFRKAVQAGKAITFVGSATDPNGPDTVDGKKFPRNHEGHPGYTVDNSSTTSGISPLVDASISANHPNIITLMIGTNDLNRNVDPTNFPTRLGALLDRIIKDAPNALVVVAKITPWQDDGTNGNAVEPFNTKIATLVQTYITSGKHVALVDMYAPFRANANYKSALMNDYLHPNDAGYVVMGDVWYAAIQAYLPAAQ